MPSITVTIEWEEPDDKHWLPASNIEQVLNSAIGRKCFKVRELEPAVYPVVLTCGGTSIPLNVGGKKFYAQEGKN